MSYHIHTSNGIILKRVPIGESNVLLHIMTLELGLVVVSSQATREQYSKLRSNVQEYTLATFSLVRGKKEWKLINSTAQKNYFFEKPKYLQQIIAKVCSLILQMVKGERKDPQIFETLKSGFDFLDEVSEEDGSFLEVLIVIRVLYDLGYVVKDETNRFLLEDLNAWDKSILEKVSRNHKEIISTINKAIKESHL